MNRHVISLLLGFLAGTGAGQAYAEPTDEESARQELEAVEGGIRMSAEQQENLAAKLSELAAALEETSAKLVTLTATIQSKELTLSRLDGELVQLATEQAAIKDELRRKKAVLSEVLAGLQRLEQNPPPALVVAPHDILSALRGAMMFGAVVPEMKDEANYLIGKLERLAAIAGEQETSKQTLLTEYATHRDLRRELDDTLAARQSLSLATEAELADESARTKKLVERSKSLKQLLSSLATARERNEALKSAAAKAREAELERQRQALARPTVPLSRSKGKLDFPVQGSILGQFGDATPLGSTLDGMAIATRVQAQVKSPADGKVEFAGPFRSYGQLLILDAGEGYLVLMAGMAGLSATNGQSIRAGEPVGVMGDGPASATLLGSAADNSRPVLYVEFRKNGQPVDPAPWWIGSRKEAMR